MIGRHKLRSRVRSVKAVAQDERESGTIGGVSVLDLSPRVRVAFTVAWLGLQGTLVLTASRRPDAAFGFRMFAESSTVSVHLSRIVKADGRTVPITSGQWTVGGPNASTIIVRFADRVKDPYLLIFDRPTHAPYGVASHLSRLQAALDDVATHTPSDRETATLVADVVVVKNGGAPYVVRLTSASR